MPEHKNSNMPTSKKITPFQTYTEIRSKDMIYYIMCEIQDQLVFFVLV